MCRYRCYPLTPDQLHDLVRSITREITQSVAHIELTPCDLEPDPHRDLCFVYTTLSTESPIRLVLSAERRFLQQLTENILGHPTSDPEDVEEYTMEFFNVLVGRLVGEYCRVVHVGARFHPPLFCEGNYASQLEAPETLKNTICFTDALSNHVMVVHDGF